MKYIFALLFILSFYGLIGQTDTENYVRIIKPKAPLTVFTLHNILGQLDSQIPELALNTPISSGTYSATEAVTLTNGFQATGEVTVKLFGSSEDMLENITYSDGLGKPIQSIDRAQSPFGKDIVKFSQYDQFGRVSKSYKPYPSTQGNGNLKTSPSTKQNIYYYTTYQDNYGFTESVYDGSPLNRVIESSSPGSDWRIVPGGNSDLNHTNKFEYETNIAATEVVKFTVDDAGSTPVVSKGAYDIKELLKNVVKNKNWQVPDGKLNTTESY